MPATQIKLFYDLNTLALNRAVICDDDSETDMNLNAHQPQAGEGVAYMARSVIPQEYVTQDLTDAAAIAIAAAQ